jgi:hypothetical protein
VSWGSSEAEGTFIVGAINTDVAETSASKAGFVVEPVSSIYRRSSSLLSLTSVEFMTASFRVFNGRKDAEGVDVREGEEEGDW